MRDNGKGGFELVDLGLGSKCHARKAPSFDKLLLSASYIYIQ